MKIKYTLFLVFRACHKTNFFKKILSSSKVLPLVLGLNLIFFSCLNTNTVFNQNGSGYLDAFLAINYKAQQAALQDSLNISVKGILNDTSGNPMVNASVSSRTATYVLENPNLERATITSATTGVDGSFTLSLKIGKYTLTVSDSNGNYLGTITLNLTSSTAATSSNNSPDKFIFMLQTLNGAVPSSGQTGISATNVPASITEGQSVNISIGFSTSISTISTVTITSSNSSVIKVNGVSSTALSFNTTNATVAQNVTLTAVAPQEGLISQHVFITLSSNGYSDTILNILATNTETQTIVFSNVPTSITEGNSGTFSINLSNQPTSDTIINLTSNDSTKLGFGTNSLTFTTSNWNTPQTVTINALTDTSQSSESIIISASASGMAVVEKTILCIDKDTTIVFGGATTVGQDGQTATMAITLSGNPGMSRTVNFTSSNTTNVTIIPSSLTFDYSDWNTSQNITLTGGNVSIGVTSTITASGAGLVSAQKIVTVYGYTDNNNGTVSYTGAGKYYGTNLVWMKCSQGQVWNSSANDCTGTGSSGTNYGAGTYQYCSTSGDTCDNGTILNGTGTSGVYTTCSNLNSGSGTYGITTWRVPTITELQSLINANYSTTIDTTYFPNTVATNYWSSTLYTSDTPWVVNFLYGISNFLTYGLSKNVRCVSTQ